MARTLEFWFEFASTYSYPAAHAVEAAAAAREVEVKWRSFLLGPIFAAQGWNDSPFNIYPAKGVYKDCRSRSRRSFRAAACSARGSPAGSQMRRGSAISYGVSTARTSPTISTSPRRS
jgi:2-hydroxychromene-2-carboxylate isomerase